MAITIGATSGKDYFLRNYYETNRDARKTATRKTMDKKQTSMADTSALKKALKDLEKVDYENTEKDGELYNKFLAFVSTYNNTIESTGDSSAEMKRLQKHLKQVTKKYKDKFSELGVKLQEDGTLKMGERAGDKFTIERMKNLFSKKDGKFGNELMSCVKKMWTQASQESSQDSGINVYV